MKHFTEEDIIRLSEDSELRKRISEFLAWKQDCPAQKEQGADKKQTKKERPVK